MHGNYCFLHRDIDRYWEAELLDQSTLDIS